MKRKYIHRVEVWTSTRVSDNFGGFTLQDAQLGESWARVMTIDASRLLQYGLDSETLSISIRLRHQADLDYFQKGLYFVYKERRFHPINIQQIDLEERELLIIAAFSRRNTE